MKKLIVLFGLLLIFTSVANATVVYYPPQATYNWVQGTSAGTKTTSITDDRIYLTAGPNVANNYVVSDQIDLSAVSFIEVNWSGYLTQWDTAFWDANVTFGVSTSAVNDAFTSSVTHDGDGTGAFGSFNKTDYVDVSHLTGAYYLKFGGELTKADDIFSALHMRLFDVIAHNYTETFPKNATSITASSATLMGEVHSIDDSIAKPGFWYGTSLPLDGTNNVSYPGAVTVEGETFSKSVGGLTSGEYYYVQSWVNDTKAGTFNLSSNYSYFITLPNAPSGMSVNDTAASSCNLQWTNATVPAGTNLSVYIRWKSGSTPPSSRTDGNFGANVSGTDWTTISGLPFETTVSFSAWTYINNSGSPTRSGWSSSPATASGTTSGALYNITVRYENESDVNGNGPVNLQEYAGSGMVHELVIYSEYQTDRVWINDSGIIWCSDGVTEVSDDTDEGNFTISMDVSVDYFEFRWNASKNSTKYCFRKRVADDLSVDDNKYSIDFYIRTDLMVYPESTPYDINPDGNGSLVKYHYSYLDQTGEFKKLENNPMSIIYAYNSTGQKMIIHSEYFDQQAKVHPWLVYQNTYYQGVKCDVLEYERIGQAPASDELEPTDIIIPKQLDEYYNFFDLINLDYGWHANGIYVTYQDTTFSTTLVNCSFYGYYNSTLMEAENTTTDSETFWYRFDEGCNISQHYYITITATLSDENNEYYEGTYVYTFTVFNVTESVVDNDTLDAIFDAILGDSPLYNYDNDAIYVPWTYLILFALCFIEMTTFGKLNAFVGSLAVGLTLIMSGLLISGITPLFSNYPWWHGAVLAVIGSFMGALSLIGLMGGVEK